MDLIYNEATDGDETEGADLGRDLLQVTRGLIVLTDERGDTTEDVGALRALLALSSS